MAPIKKSSLVDQVYRQLREEILTLQRPLGGKLNVNELQNELEVSCTPIREAVNRLQQEGLVRYETNVGARVLSLDEHDVEEIQQLAVTLHCAAARLAAERGDRAVILSELRRYLEEYRRAKSVHAQVMAVNRFMGVFYHNCGNRRLDESMISIQGQQLLLRYIYATQGADRERDGADFAAMVTALERGDEDALCGLIKGNAERTVPTILEYLNTPR